MNETVKEAALLPVRSNAGLEVRRFIALMLFLAAAIAECVLAWAVSLPDVLILPAGAAFGYWVLPKVSDALMRWATSNVELRGRAP